MNTDKRRFILSILLSILVFVFPALVQPAAEKPRITVDRLFEDKVQTLSLNSKLMSREMLYRVILPDGYSALKQRTPNGYPVVYLLHGLTGHFNNWTDKTKIVEYSKAYGFIIVTPEGGNGWYTDSVSVPNDKYESYIIRELVPEIDKKFRTIPDRKSRAIAGLSMGGYGALKFGIKYPEMFSLVGSFSGALGVATFTENDRNADFMKTLNAIYGAAGSETRKANDLFGLVRALKPEKTKSLPFLYIDCGIEDFLFQNNRDFIALLLEKKVPHEFRQLPGAHNWTYWDSQVKEFMELSQKYFDKK